MRCPRNHAQSGVTLLEMIIVISITAIIAGAVAVFISRPVESYADAARRAELTDIADTALRRMTRDLRTALPNSIRIVESPPASGIWYLEFLQMSGGGRYRAQAADDGTGDPLLFSAVDAEFDVIGPVPAPPAAGDSIVIYNLSATGTDANAYSGDNRRGYAGLAGSRITVTTTLLPFPFASPGNRFQVVQPVTYQCNPNAGTRELRRYWGYAIDPAQPTPPGTGSNALLASDIFSCSFTYDASGATGRTGVVRLQLEVRRDDERIQLFQQVHVSNVP